MPRLHTSSNRCVYNYIITYTCVYICVRVAVRKWVDYRHSCCTVLPKLCPLLSAAYLSAKNWFFRQSPFSLIPLVLFVVRVRVYHRPPVSMARAMFLLSRGGGALARGAMFLLSKGGVH